MKLEGYDYCPECNAIVYQYEYFCSKCGKYLKEDFRITTDDKTTLKEGAFDE